MMCTNQAKLLNEINCSSFALDDLRIYLDTHPADQAALDLFHYYQGIRNKCMAEYTVQYGPLQANDVLDQNVWTWNRCCDPWPWELEV